MPHTLISGRRPRLNLPESLHDPDIRAETPDSYGKIIRKRIQMLSKLATVANESADLELEKRAKRHAPARQLKKGDMVHLYRPVTKAAKDSGCSWIGPYRVAKASERVVKICDSTGFSDWVHRSHLRYLPEREDHLKTAADRALEHEMLFGDDQIASSQNRPVDAPGSYSEPLAALPRAGRPTADKPDKAQGNSRKRKRLLGKFQPATKRSNSASLPAAPNSIPDTPPVNSSISTPPPGTTSLTTPLTDPLTTSLTPVTALDSNVTGETSSLPCGKTSTSPATAGSLCDDLSTTVTSFFDQFSRRSGRVTKKPDRLVLDPKKKNY